MHVELVRVREHVCVAVARLARGYDAGSSFDSLDLLAAFSILLCHVPFRRTRLSLWLLFS